VTESAERYEPSSAAVAAIIKSQAQAMSLQLTTANLTGDVQSARRFEAG
jgi:hypothetical protein